MLTQDEQRILSRLRDSYRSVSLKPADFMPVTLYHYTSERGLLGIVETGVLRATNFSFLNDASEIRYGEAIIREVLAKRLAAESTPLVHTVLSATDEDLGKLGSHLEFYLSCFCTEPDLLSQWRGYSSVAGRFCIGFDTETLPNPTLKYNLARVIYDRGEQAQKVGRAIDRAVDAIKEAEGLRKRSDDDELLCQIRTLLTENFVRILCFFKHPGFAEEKEWRAVHQLTNNEEIHFEAAGGVIKPYVELIVGTSDPRRLPISEVIVGASSLGQQSKKSVELLLSRYGYKGGEVKESSVPYRDT